MPVSVSSGMLLSVFVVMLLTVFYELFKVWRVWLESNLDVAQSNLNDTPPPAVHSDSSAVLESSQSELSLTPGGPHLLPAENVRNRSASLWNPTCGLIYTFSSRWPERLRLFAFQLGSSRRPDVPPRSAGDSGLHADAVCHVVQHLDLFGGYSGLWARIFHLVPALEQELLGSTLTLNWEASFWKVEFATCQWETFSFNERLFCI